ncbi:glycosyltransferase family 2 protein [Metabacillus fastidiosus]|uniref:glycosyltransferase family 2 protein n=1 Tax=Metabacillus fastidiosus TaxID=1458 RepID=UPI003D2686F0
MSKSLVSIITPAYNASEFISETIDSVKAQTFSNWEMIIVDDCSSDHTREIVRKAVEKDKRIKLIELPQNGGPANARNVAINAAKGDFLAFLDSDDLWLPHKLERQLSFMEEHDIAFSYTMYQMMDQKGEKKVTLIHVPPSIVYKDLLKNTIIGTLTVMLDKRKTGNIQLFPARNCSEDYGLWLSILAKGITAYGINEELALYRKCENSLSSNKLKSALKTWNTYRKIERLNIFASCWYFMNYSLRALKKHTNL